MVMRPAMMYALQMAALAKIQEDKMKVGELKRIRFLSGVTRPGRILNKVNQWEDSHQVFWRQSCRGKVSKQIGQAIAGLLLFSVFRTHMAWIIEELEQSAVVVSEE